MAQGSKSRVVIWVIVGVLVVVAAILLITRPKEGKPLDASRFVEVTGPRLDKLETRVSKAGLAPDVAQKITDEINKARTALQELQGMTDAPAAQSKQKMEEVNTAMREAKRLLREATGRGGDEE